MPYSGKDTKELPENVQKLPDNLRKQWTSVWDSAHAACMKENGSDSKMCEIRAFSMANGVLKKRLKAKKDSEEMKAIENIEELYQLFEVDKPDEEPEVKELERPVEVELLLDLAAQIKEMTYSEKEAKVRASFAKYRKQNGQGYAYPIEVYENYLICRNGGGMMGEESSYESGEYYKHPFSWKGEEVVFKKPVHVKKVWEEVPDNDNGAKDLSMEELDLLNTEVCFGGSVKSLGTGGKFGGWLVLFGNSKQHDVSKFKDFFSKQTDFGKHRKTPVYYAHGLDKSLKKVEIGEGTVSIKDAGVWLEGQLKLRNAYENMVWKMVKSGKLGLSSGTASHLIEREPQDDGTNKILKWPLGLDASLTPIPADPRIKAMPLKGLYDQLKSGEFLDPDDEDPDEDNPEEEEETWPDEEDWAGDEGDEDLDEENEEEEKSLNLRRLSAKAKLQQVESQLETLIVEGDY